MRNQIDPRIAENIITTAISRVWSLPSDRIICTRRGLREAVAAAIQDAYVIGFLAGQEADLREVCRTGSPHRPPWMDIRLDDRAAMYALRLRLWPIMLRSFHNAGYHCLGDLRWVPLERLIQVFYVGRKTAKQIRAVIEMLERSAESAKPTPADDKA
jgi:hypothetical protein